MSMKKGVFFITTLLGFFLAAGQADAASFRLSSGSFKVECDASATIFIETNGAELTDAANVIVHYNPSEIQIQDSNPAAPGVQIGTGSAFENYADNVVDPVSGTIRLTGFTIGRGLNTGAGSAVYGTIRFASKPGVDATAMSIEYVAGSTTDSNIAEYLTSDDLLTSVRNGSYSFAVGPCVEDVIPPRVSSVGPASGAIDVPLDSNITFHVTDNQAGVDINSLVFVVNGITYTKDAPEVSITGTPRDYTVVINPAADFPAGTTITVRVSAKDLANNVMKTYAWSFNQPPAPEPQAPTCAELGCSGSCPAADQCPVCPVAPAQAPTVCGNGVCDRTETEVTCRFDCAPKVTSEQPTTGGITPKSDLQVFVLDGSLKLDPSGSGVFTVLPGAEYEVRLVNSSNSPMTSVMLQATTGTYAMTSKDGGATYTTKVLAPRSLGKNPEVITIDYAGLPSASIRYDLSVVGKPVIYEVVNGKNVPVPDAIVTLYRYTTMGKEKVNFAASYQTNPQNTDANGAYSFYVPAGNYTIVVEKDGYITKESIPMTIGSGLYVESMEIAQPLLQQIGGIISSDQGTLVGKTGQILAESAGALGGVAKNASDSLERVRRNPRIQGMMARFAIPLAIITAVTEVAGWIWITILPFILPVLRGVQQRIKKRIYVSQEEARDVLSEGVTKRDSSALGMLLVITAVVSVLYPERFLITLMVIQVAGIVVYKMLTKRFKNMMAFERQRTEPKSYV